MKLTDLLSVIYDAQEIVVRVWYHDTITYESSITYPDHLWIEYREMFKDIPAKHIDGLKVQTVIQIDNHITINCEPF